ncbi:MAG: hypothetical protein ABR497_02730 [Kiritimatiellia bacterium]|nr:hypothetical protein [Lentisphaerota bacterium]
MYRVGTASGAASEPQARQEAFEDAVRIILDEIMTRGGLDGPGRAAVRGQLALKTAETVPGAVYLEEGPAGFEAWVQVSCTLAERDVLLREIADARARLQARADYDAQLHARWQEAQAAALRGEHTAALELLKEIEYNYGRIMTPAFPLEEVRLLMGDLQAQQRDNLAARAFYETVAGLSTSTVWQSEARRRLEALPSPPRLWPLRSRWQNRPVALLCLLQTDDRPPARFTALSGILHRDATESRMSMRDLAGWQPAALDQIFDARDAAPAAKAARDIQTDIALLVYVNTDSTLRGQTQEIMGVQMPVTDTSVRFMVIDTRDNRIIYSDEFRELRGNRSDTRLAERIATIMISNYLAPKCPALPASDPPHEAINPVANGSR